MPVRRHEFFSTVGEFILWPAKEKNTLLNDWGLMSKPNATRRRLGSWFSSLSPERRIELAEEAETFRREARIARDSRDTEDVE